MMRLAMLLAVFTTMASGCSGTMPMPWEKDLLAKPGMAMDADPLEQRFNQHVYASKENSDGGGVFGGGGCGCN